ncbi:MAG: acyltransferase [Acidobacteriaceae bacterium]
MPPSHTAAFARTPSTATHPALSAPTHFPALDGLRAVAFLMVFTFHYLQIPWGWAGVDIFFVLSGFLITGILFDARDQPHRIRDFYLRRTLRIFPLYYGVILLLVLLWPIFHWEWNWHWLAWPLYLGNFLRGYRPFLVRSPLEMLADFQPLSRTFPSIQPYLGHFWSLCVEEQFYLVWPWVLFWLRDRRKLLALCLACVALCPLARVVGSHMLPKFMLDQEVLYRWTPFRVDALLLGGALALVRRGPSPWRLLLLARIGFATLTAAVLLWLALNPSARQGTLTYVYPAWKMTWGLSFIDLFAACVVVMALEFGSITFRLLNLRPLRWLGRISYGAYVFHDLFNLEILDFVQHRTGHYRLPSTALALAITLLLAWASFRWFEAPFIRLKDRLTQAAPQAEPEAPTNAFEPTPSRAVA